MDFPLYFQKVKLLWQGSIVEIDYRFFRVFGPYFIGKSLGTFKKFIFGLWSFMPHPYYRFKTKYTLAGIEEIQQGKEESLVACVVGTGWWESTDVQTITHIILLYFTALYCISLHYYSAHCCTNTYIALHYATRGKPGKGNIFTNG